MKLSPRLCGMLSFLVVGVLALAPVPAAAANPILIVTSSSNPYTTFLPERYIPFWLSSSQEHRKTLRARADPQRAHATRGKLGGGSDAFK